MVVERTGARAVHPREQGLEGRQGPHGGIRGGGRGGYGVGNGGVVAHGLLPRMGDERPGAGGRTLPVRRPGRALRLRYPPPPMDTMSRGAARSATVSRFRSAPDTTPPPSTGRRPSQVRVVRRKRTGAARLA